MTNATDSILATLEMHGFTPTQYLEHKAGRFHRVEVPDFPDRAEPVEFRRGAVVVKLQWTHPYPQTEWWEITQWIIDYALTIDGVETTDRQDMHEGSAHLIFAKAIDKIMTEGPALRRGNPTEQCEDGSRMLAPWEADQELRRFKLDTGSPVEVHEGYPLPLTPAHFRVLRTGAGLTQDTIAKRFDVASRTARRWEATHSAPSEVSRYVIDAWRSCNDEVAQIVAAEKQQDQAVIATEGTMLSHMVALLATYELEKAGVKVTIVDAQGEGEAQ